MWIKHYKLFIKIFTNLIVFFAISKLTSATTFYNSLSSTSKFNSGNSSLGESCNTSTDCMVKGSDCWRQHCHCDEYLKTEGQSQCLGVKLNQSCDADYQCSFETSGSVCLNRKCACAVNVSFEIDNSCQAGAHINNTCTYSELCQKYTPGSKCNSTCQCSKDLPHYNFEVHACSKGLKTVLLTANCSTTEECTVYNSVCVNDTCECKDGLQAMGNTLCKGRVLNSACSYDYECEQETPGSHCQNKCICYSKRPLVIGGVCLPSSHWNKSCVFNDQCEAETKFSVCQHEICSCPPHLPVYALNKCNLARALHHSCNTSEQCRFIDEHAECVELPRKVMKFCKCIKGYYIDKTRHCRENDHTDSKTLYIISGGIVGFLILIFFIVCISFWKYRKRKYNSLLTPLLSE